MINNFDQPSSVADTYKKMFSQPEELPTKVKYPTFYASIGQHFDGTMEDDETPSTQDMPTITQPVSEDSEDDDKHDIATDVMPSGEPAPFQHKLTHAKAALAKEHHNNSGLRTYCDDSGAINSSLHMIHNTGSLGKMMRSNAYEKNVDGNVKMIDKALDNQSTSGSMIVYSGIHQDPSKHFVPDEHGNVPDSVIVHHPAYMSTSTSPKIAKFFAVHKEHMKGPRFNQDHHPIRNPEVGDVEEENDHAARFQNPTSNDNRQYLHMLRLHLPDGTKAASVWGKFADPDEGESSPNNSEKEILLHRGHNIRIHRSPSVAAMGNATPIVWHAEVVGHDPMPLDKISSAISGK